MPKNFYDKLPAKYKSKARNPNYKVHKIKVPFRMIIIGGSGSGKTNTLLDLVSKFKNTFNHLIICTMNSDEPLYNYLRERLGAKVTFYENGEVPDLEELEAKHGKGKQLLTAFDDLVLSNQKAIEDFFIRARKICGGISCVYLTQSYFEVRKLIRLQCNYVVCKKLSSKKDLKLIVKEYQLSEDIDKVMRVYEDVVGCGFTDFFMIDLETNEPKDRFRKNYSPIRTFPRRLE